MPDSPDPAWQIDVKPLPKPTNALAWFAARLRSRAAGFPPAAAAQAAQGAAWLEWLAERVPYASDDPIMLCAAAQAAISADERVRLAALLADIEAAVVEAQAQAQAQARAPE